MNILYVVFINFNVRIFVKTLHYSDSDDIISLNKRNQRSHSFLGRKILTWEPFF